MTVETMGNSTHKPAALGELEEVLGADPSLSGMLWVGFPVLSDVDSVYKVDAIYLSPDHGILVFDAVEGADLGDYPERQEDLIRLLRSKFLQQKGLSRRGELPFRVDCITFAPALSTSALKAKYPEDEYVDNATTLPDRLAAIRSGKLALRVSSGSELMP